MNNRFKNTLLFSCFLIGQIPVIFFGMNERLNLGLFVERSTRIDFFMLYYANAISFLILAGIIHYPKGINRRISRFILIICYLDLLHLLLFAKQGFGMTKIGVAIVIFFMYELIKKRYE